MRLDNRAPAQDILIKLRKELYRDMERDVDNGTTSTAAEGFTWITRIIQKLYA